MDATALRWVLGIIGVLCIVGVYLYSLYQNKLRRQAEIRTFTEDEIEAGFIEDEDLRQELSNINAMLDADVSAEDVSEIKINPALDKKNEPEPSTATESALPHEVCDLMPDHRIAHVLKAADQHLLTDQEIASAMNHAGFSLNENGHYRLSEEPQAEFKLLNLTAGGSFNELQQQGVTQGMVCCINLEKCQFPLECYELMLKKVDELVRLLDLKVYDQNEELLTLQHVTEIREKLIDGQGRAVDQKVDA